MLIYEVNTASFMFEMKTKYGDETTLASIPNSWFESLRNFDTVWMMGVWKRSEKSRQIARSHSGLIRDFKQYLSDYKEEDVFGSPYSVYSYEVDPYFGGNAALVIFRDKLKKYNIKLILDFVPNHFAVDTPLLDIAPDLFLSDIDGDGFHYNEHFYLYGRDPNFPGWTDTVQLDYSKPLTRAFMTDELKKIARICDGVRCDMSILVVKSVFEETWEKSFYPKKAEFWPHAVTEVKAENPDFVFIAESYWNMEWDMLCQGFDYSYDKKFYERLCIGRFEDLFFHLRAEPVYQNSMLVFTENHDEKRSADTLDYNNLKGIFFSYMTPGAVLIHYGQESGMMKRMPVHLKRLGEAQDNRYLEEFNNFAIIRNILFGSEFSFNCLSYFGGVYKILIENSEGKFLVVVNFNDDFIPEKIVEIPEDYYPDKTGVYKLL
ncbi:MAG: alpha-amylase [Candidatus Delongbacteria bacterium]|nr:alpha-amylase [Candidatus Delongbacteria bacterium]MBN2835046.1 alpha-amylase [Candidatus Delongbacteria bacterium]